MGGPVDTRDIWSRSWPWVHVLSEAPDLEPGGPGIYSVVLDGARMRTVDELFREFVREFRFPEYFGWNWAAFAECIRDLSWLPARSYRIVVRNADALLADDPLDLPTFIRQMEEAGSAWANSFALGVEWGGGEVPFNLVLVGQPGQQP